MKKFSAFMLAFAVSLVVLSGLIFNRTANANASVGTIVADFKLSDSTGKEQSLSTLKGKKGTLIVFYSTKCPWVKAYAERINQIAKDYQAKGISVVGINSNFNETEEDIKTNAAALSFAMLVDKDSKIADQLGAGHTPETFLLDANNKVVFHGAIDNNKDESMVTKKFLRDAIDATLEGKAIEKSDVPAIGCTIKKAPATQKQ